MHLLFLFLFLSGLPLRLVAADGGIVVKNGETIAFLGDSITAAGAKPGGYCQLVLEGLKHEGVEAKGVFAGISGHKSNQMLARLDKDVISKKPDWMTLSCGVNDVWHGARGVELDDYVVNIGQIIDKAQAAGIKVVVLTSTMIRENADNDLNHKLEGYNAALKKLAKEKNCLLADLNAAMQQEVRDFPFPAPEGKKLTTDGVHMNPYGNMMMAAGVLKALGVSPAAIEAGRERWKGIAGSKPVTVKLDLSITEYEKITKKAGKPAEQVFSEALAAKKAEMLGTR